LEATIQEARQIAARIKEPDELWELERHLTQRRKEIDAKYEFKYSVLLLVLAGLVREQTTKDEMLSTHKGLLLDRTSTTTGQRENPRPVCGVLSSEKTD